jgi:aquaporin Z
MIELRGIAPSMAKRDASLPQRLIAEMLGTFALVFVAAGSEVAASLSHGEVSTAARAVAPGLMVMAVIYAFGDISGAHVNPAVTLAFAVRGVFEWARVPAYWVAQLVGAIAAAAVLRGTFGDVAHVGASRAHFGGGSGFTMELVLSVLLIMVILNTATRAQVLGPNAAIAVGATIALCGLFGAAISGASMNPARSLGPALVGGTWSNLWIYLVAPFVAAFIAVCFTDVLHPARDSDEVDAAEGEGGDTSATGDVTVDAIAPEVLRHDDGPARETRGETSEQRRSVVTEPGEPNRRPRKPAADERAAPRDSRPLKSR